MFKKIALVAAFAAFSVSSVFAEDWANIKHGTEFIKHDGVGGAGTASGTASSGTASSGAASSGTASSSGGTGTSGNGGTCSGGHGAK